MRSVLLLLALFASLAGAILRSDGSVSSSDKINFAAAIFDSKGEYLCAGSIITSQHIVTAASCFLNVKQGYAQWSNRDAVVAVGALNLQSTDIRLHLTASVTPHPSYNVNNYKYHPADLVDLAVIKLQHHLVFGEDHKVSTVVLLSERSANIASIGTETRTMGWGPTSPTPGAAHSDTLQYMRMDIASGEECKWDPVKYFEHNHPEKTSSSCSSSRCGSCDDMESCNDQSSCKWNVDYLASSCGPANYIPYLTYFDPETMICILASSSKTPACDGRDRGDPMIVYQDGDKNTPYLVGVYSDFAPEGECRKTSTEFGSDFPNYYKYTSIRHFGPWIQEVTGVLLPYAYPETAQAYSPPTPRPTSALPQTCSPSTCNWISASHACWCDNECKHNGDCCDNYDDQCKPKSVDEGDGCAQAGVCGQKAGPCWCDSKCEENEDCCENYKEECLLAEGGPYSCVGICGQRAMSGCWCDENCAETQDCCKDWEKVCEDNNDFGGGGSCIGKCGLKSGECWCDPACEQQGDCCPNYKSRCASDLGSCQGFCGHKAMNKCWCDASCMENGDCCDDFDVYCPDTHQPDEIMEKKYQKMQG